MRIDPMPADAYDRGFHAAITIAPLDVDMLTDTLEQQWKHNPLQIEDLDKLDYGRVIFDLKQQRLHMRKLFQLLQGGDVDILNFSNDGYLFASVGVQSAWKNFNAFESRRISEYLGFNMMGLEHYLFLQSVSTKIIDKQGATWLAEYDKHDTFPDYPKVHKGEQLRGYYNQYKQEMVIDSYDPYYYSKYLGFRGELFIPSVT